MTTHDDARADLPVLLFEDTASLEEWLERNHATAPGVWMRLAKKASGLRSVTYAEALDVALCYGWIDGLKKSHDEATWLQKFTPRKRRSTWSKVNRDKALALMESGRMRPAGLAEVERARADGRWDAAYDSQRNASVPPELQAALDGSPAARDFFETLDRANRYAVIWRVQTAARPETRERRIRQLVEMLERRETLH